jgi:5-hydroxyisourate hydrolase-like protein (transthyretin family)
VFEVTSPFFRRVALDVEIGEGHHHIPLLLSPYGIASYRGS